MYTNESAPAGNSYTVATPNKTPEMEMVRNELDKAIAELSEQVRGLEARLMPVLTEPRPTPNSLTDAKDPETHSQTVAHLRSMVERVRGAIQCVVAIQQRLEV